MLSTNMQGNNQQQQQHHHHPQQHQQQPQQHRRPGALPNSIVGSERCCTFKIAPEERRYRDFELEQSRILKEIMQKTNTKIEVTTTKDGALNFCIIGKEGMLPLAKNLVLQDFQISVTLTVSVPKSLHGRLLGPKGARLASIQDETQTKIAIPRREEDSDIIKIVGLKNNAEMAVRSIEKYAREFAGKAVEKVTIERIYLLFITGPFNENLKRWDEMGVKVSTSGGLLPSNNDRESGHADEVTFTIVGETNAVQQVKDEIVHTYEDKKKKCTSVNIEVKKAQHKYILGSGGQNLRQLFAKTGVSVELPHESESETITLRGERSKIGPALSELYNQAHSETDDSFECETWLHKYLIGAKKTNFLDFKALGVDVKSVDDKIKLHGPPTEIENIKDIFESELQTLTKTIIRKDVRVEPRIHGFIIGRAGATVDQIREESGAYIMVPKNEEASELITLEGTAEAVAIAEEKINAIAKKYEASRKLVIDQQLHGSIIGRGGEKIRSIREKFSQVIFTFPDQGSKHNEITIVGPTDEVEACYKYLDDLHQQLQENNHQVQVPIRKDVIKYLPDAQAAIKRIKMDHRVKVDLFIPDEQNGKKETTNATSIATTTTTNATNNKDTKVNESSNKAANNSVVESVDGSDNKKKNKNKNKNKQQQQPAQQSNGVAAPSSQTTKNSNEKNPEKDKNASTDAYAVVIGKKEDVDQAKVKLSKLFDELATTTEFEMKLSHKLRSHLGPKTRLYRQFLDEFQQKIVVSFPPSPNKQQQQQGKTQNGGGDTSTQQANATETNGLPNDDVNSKKKGSGKKEAVLKEDNNNNSQDRIDTVKIRGPKNIAKKAEKRFEALIAECQDRVDKNYTAQVSVETAVIEKFVYADKLKLNKIRDTQNVKLNIPDKRDSAKLQCSIVGYEKNVQTALQQFNKLVTEVAERSEETIEIPSQVHPRLIGAQGRAVKKLMEDYKIGVKFARQNDPNPNAVTLSGRADNILAAKNHMMKLADQYMASAVRQAAANAAASNPGNNNNVGGAQVNKSAASNELQQTAINLNDNNNSQQLQPTPHEAAAAALAE
jgi:predicted RNA-binding protein YlqC (UPF0109 family)